MIASFEISKQEDIQSVIGRIRHRSSVPEGTMEAVQEIIDAVRDRGDEALEEMTLRFDGVKIKSAELEVPRADLEKAFHELDRETRGALEKAQQRFARFSRWCLLPDWEEEISTGVKVGQVNRPFDCAGIYIPGGRFPYPSTVLVTAVPAQEASVGDIVMCIPPGENGKINSITLAAASLINNCRIFRIGGAQAIAAMAFGTETVPKCQMVSGPGNIYVATAKRLLSGTVSIDIQAGPSEIAVYLDGSVDISFPVSDVLAQLEHDPMSFAVMVSESKELLQSAAGVLKGLVEGSAQGPEELGPVNLVFCQNGRLAIRFLNDLAPEHLAIMTENADSVLPEISAAGCVFIGAYSAVALGDYLAGPSHVLPTGGTASISSGLSAQDFRRTMNVITYTREGFKSDAPVARLLAKIENLERHATSLDIRMR